MQYVYLLRAGQYYKIGISHNVRSRAAMIQPHIPDKVEIICTKFADTEAYNIEQEIHGLMSQWKAPGANEWFMLTADQALEVCVMINNYPDIDISERVMLNGLLQLTRSNQKRLDKKLDHILYAYQKTNFNPKAEIREVVKYEPRPVVERISKEEQDRELYKQALGVLDTEDKASTSMLQRHLGIGYGRAARLIDELEADGLIGLADGSRPRSVMRNALQHEIDKFDKIDG